MSFTTFDNIETPFASSITRGPMPRWQRKQLEEAMSPKKSMTTPKVGSGGWMLVVDHLTGLLLEL